MSLMVVTINNLSPALDHKFQEVERVERYLHYAAAAVRQGQGLVTSGNILDNSNTVMGTWTYTPQAGS
jgi:hypothetical protein